MGELLVDVVPSVVGSCTALGSAPDQYIWQRTAGPAACVRHLRPQLRKPCEEMRPSWVLDTFEGNTMAAGAH